MPTSPMQEAFKKAREAAAKGEVPVGAVLVHKNKIIASCGNLTRTCHDPTGHAEMRVIRLGCQILQSERLPECDLYVTLEPCAMCAAAISFARIRRLYYGAPDEKGGAVIHGARFFSQKTCHHRPEIYSGLGEEESKKLLKDFFQNKRKNSADGF